MEPNNTIITSLIADLCGDDDTRRSQASFTLGVLGEPAVAPLIDLLAVSDSETRKRAAWVLGVIGAPALPALLKLAEGNDQQLRIEAIRVLGIVGEARALNQLLIGLTDPDARVAARAARAIGKIADPRAYHPLITALRHPSPDVCYEVCRALLDLRVRDAIPALREFAASGPNRITTWGASVALVANHAADELTQSPASNTHADYIAQALALLQQQRCITEDTERFTTEAPRTQR
ncbi:HEAT repeat domain-containing protein [Candidatus Viridilinea mediisalina]|uniref:PBS lyase n=1 Tax=Candidatus Viridilinea mediisalina TaxID=2024553 RepID=A0A2A6RG93_9CHLR|nr:HEAT repeat domain-containing protein [Candidatus Viridilinea mediisalina]PDW02042.1 PBS lyase [Candidatus Viridilinea mediisalina]